MYNTGFFDADLQRHTILIETVDLRIHMHVKFENNHETCLN